MKEIIDLDKKREIHSKIYDQVTEIHNMETGEITHKMRSFMTKSKTKDQFVQLFLENLMFLNENLSNPAIRVLLGIIKRMNFQNIFEYSSSFVTYFENKNILKKTSVYKGLKELEDKGVITKIQDADLKKELDIVGDKFYIINPNIVGRGSFRDLQKLRQTIIRTFDFEKLEFTQEYGMETFYDGYRDLQENPENYKIEEIKQEKNKNLEKIDVILSEKNETVDEDLERDKEICKSLKQVEVEKNKQLKLNSDEISENEIYKRLKEEELYKNNNSKAQPQMFFVDSLDDQEYIDKISKGEIKPPKFEELPENMKQGINLLKRKYGDNSEPIIKFDPIVDPELRLYEEKNRQLELETKLQQEKNRQLELENRQLELKLKLKEN